MEQHEGALREDLSVDNLVEKNRNGTLASGVWAA
jgi:hypothetical protein